MFSSLPSPPPTAKPLIVEKNLGLLVLDRPDSRSVEFSLPVGTATPASVTVGKSCCTAFDENPNWTARPGGKLTIKSGPVAGKFTWSAYGAASDGRPLFALYVHAQVTPRVRFELPSDAPISAKGGTTVRTAGRMLCVHRNGEKPPALPVVTKADRATFAWAGSPTSTPLADGYVQAEFPFAVSVQVGDGDAIEQHPFEANWPGKDGAPVRFAVPVAPIQRLRIEPKALLYAAAESQTKRLLVLAHDEEIATFSAEGEGDVTIRKTERHANGRGLVVEVECRRTARGKAGAVVLKTNLGAATAPVFRLGGES